MSISTSKDVIAISSKYRTNITDLPKSCVFALTKPLQGTYELSSFNVSNLLYNVVTGENDKVWFTYNAVDKSFIIPPGWYSYGDLAAELQTLMRGAGVTNNVAFTVTYSAVTGLLTFASNDATTFKFTFGTNTSQSSRRQLGFNQVDSSTAASIVSPNASDIRLHSNMMVDILQDNNRYAYLDNVGQQGSFFLPIPQGNNFGDVLNINTYNSYVQYARFDTAQYNLNVNIYSEDGELLSLNGAEWVMVLKKISD